jgi:excinuclease UvrABC helicase subunit UvrB
LLDDDLRQVLSDISLHYNKENQELEFLHDKLEYILKSEQMTGKGFITASDVVLFAKSEYQITLRQHAVGSALKKKFGSRKTFNTADGPRKGYDFNSKSQ